MERYAALLIVDLQNDFCPGGRLPVPEGDKVVEPLNLAIDRFHGEGLPIIASRDWHPAVTTHFEKFGGIWPEHCGQDTAGAYFHPDLRLPPDVTIITKGTDPEQDNYSAFEGMTAEGLLLEQFLEARGIKKLYIGGLATDYCVKATAVAGLFLGKKVTVLLDAIAGVDMAPGDSDRALELLRQEGAEFMRAVDL